MTRALRVAVVHSRYLSAEPSGENAVVDNEVAALRRAGVEVALIERTSDDLEGEPLRRTRAALRVATGRGAEPLAALAAFGPDVVHVHNLFPNFGTSWLAEVGVPIVRTVHNYRAVCAAGILFRDGAPCTECIDGSRLSGLRHRCYRDSFVATLPLTISQRARLSDDPSVRAAARVIVLSERTRARYEALGVPPKRLVVWPNFLPDARRAHAPSQPTVREDFFVFAGRLRKEKGILELLRTWPADRRLVVVGSGPEEQEVRRLAGPSVELRGTVSPAEVDDLLRRAAAIVIPSLGDEQFPMTYPEAIATSTPVIAFATNTVAELVQRDGTGVVHQLGAELAPSLETAAALDVWQPAAAAMDVHYSEAAYLRRALRLYEILAGR